MISTKQQAILKSLRNDHRVVQHNYQKYANYPTGVDDKIWEALPELRFDVDDYAGAASTSPAVPEILLANASTEASLSVTVPDKRNVDDAHLGRAHRAQTISQKGSGTITKRLSRVASIVSSDADFDRVVLSGDDKVEFKMLGKDNVVDMRKVGLGWNIITCPLPNVTLIPRTYKMTSFRAQQSVHSSATMIRH